MDHLRKYTGWIAEGGYFMGNSCMTLRDWSTYDEIPLGLDNPREVEDPHSPLYSRLVIVVLPDGTNHRLTGQKRTNAWLAGKAPVPFSLCVDWYAMPSLDSAIALRRDLIGGGPHLEAIQSGPSMDSLRYIGAGGERAIEAVCTLRQRAGENRLEQIVRQVMELIDLDDPLRANLYRIGFFSTMEVILSTIDMDCQQMVNLARGESVF